MTTNPQTIKSFLALLLLCSCCLQAQIAIGTNNPATSAALELQSNTAGILIPRMTKSDRDAIATPAQGLLIYQTDETEGFYFYNNTPAAWQALSDDLDGDPKNEIELPTPANKGDMSYWDGERWLLIPATTNQGATLKMIEGVPTWTGGTPE